MILKSQARNPGVGTLFLLMGVLILHFIDRQIVAILLPDIASDLSLTDTQAGILTGIGFALLYSVLGIPIARLADKADRVRIMSVAAIVWSAMTAVTRLASSFITLLAARMGVAIGEAGGIPPLHSLVADLYPDEQRARAFSVVQLGGPLGVLLAFFVFGALAEVAEWRTLFYATGLLGVAFAFLFWRVAPEPRRERQSLHRQTGDDWRAALRVLLSSRAYLHLVAGTALAGFALYALVTWMPSYLGRSFGTDRSEIGLVLGLLFGIGGALGVLFFGWLADRVQRARPGAHALVPALMVFVAAPLIVLAFRSSSQGEALLLLAVPIVMVSGWQAPTIAAVQKVAAPDTRALAAALLMLMLNLVGLGLGPLAVGIISDVLAPRFGEQSLRYALMIAAPALVWAGIHWLLAARELARLSGRSRSPVPEPSEISGVRQP
ncbi:MAG: MFS transporter [Parvularcula sp.]|nr:MFS transporter [Parvularcula sp.]